MTTQMPLAAAPAREPCVDPKRREIVVEIRHWFRMSDENGRQGSKSTVTARPCRAMSQYSQSLRCRRCHGSAGPVSGGWTSANRGGTARNEKRRAAVWRALTISVRAPRFSAVCPDPPAGQVVGHRERRTVSAARRTRTRRPPRSAGVLQRTCMKNRTTSSALMQRDRQHHDVVERPEVDERDRHGQRRCRPSAPGRPCSTCSWGRRDQQT